MTVRWIVFKRQAGSIAVITISRINLVVKAWATFTNRACL